MKKKQLKGFQIQQTLSDKCIECGSKYIVNKKYKLCERHNKERLQMQILQVQGKENNKSTKRNKFKRENKFCCSNGELVTQAEINKRYKEVCSQIDLERERYCEATGRTDLPLSHSHTISQRRCKHLRKTELIWDKDNIFLESMGTSDSGHVTWDHGNLDDKKKLFNFERKLAYIKIHDQETYQKIINEL